MPFTCSDSSATARRAAGKVGDRNARRGDGSQRWGAHRRLWMLGALLSVFVLSAPAARAEAPGGEDQHRPGHGYRGWPALIRVSAPVTTPANQWSFGAHGGAGYIESSGEPDTGATRLLGGLGVSYSAGKGFAFAADLRSRVDLFSAPSENTNLYGEPRLGARYVLPNVPGVDLGVEADLRLVGDSAPAIEPSALSPSLVALVGLPVGNSTYLAGVLGFHLDLSQNAVPEPANISPGDRLSLGASCCPAVRFGLGVSQKFGRLPTEWLAEVTADILVGDQAPGVFTSPWTLSVGARHPLLRTLALQGFVDVGLSARPPDSDPPVLVPIGPRVGAIAALVWTPGKRAPPPEKVEPATAPPEEAEEKEPEPAPPPIPTSPVGGLIVDEAGQGMADVAVTLVFPDGQTRAERTFADGSFSFPEVPEDVEVRVDIKTPGYDPAKLEFGAGSERHAEVVLYPSLPAGQVRGSILDLQGNPVRATVTITSSGTTVDVAEDGSFEIELPPGKHTLTVEYEGLRTQHRVIEVEERGVVILNIALTR